MVISEQFLTATTPATRGRQWCSPAQLWEQLQLHQCRGQGINCSWPWSTSSVHLPWCIPSPQLLQLKQVDVATGLVQRKQTAEFLQYYICTMLYLVPFTWKSLKPLYQSCSQLTSMKIKGSRRMWPREGADIPAGNSHGIYNSYAAVPDTKSSWWLTICAAAQYKSPDQFYTVQNSRPVISSTLVIFCHRFHPQSTKLNFFRACCQSWDVTGVE